MENETLEVVTVRCTDCGVKCASLGSTDVQCTQCGIARLLKEDK